MDYLSKLNWPTMCAMFAVSWYFTHDIRNSLSKIEEGLIQQGQRTDKLYEMYCEIRKETYTMFSETQKEIKQLHIDFIKKEHKE